MKKKIILYSLQFLFSIFIFYVSTIISNHSSIVGIILSLLSIFYFITIVYKIIEEIIEENNN